MSTSVSVPSWPGVHRIKNLMANNSSSAEVDRSLIVRDTCVGSESPTWIRRLATTTRDHKFGKILFVWSFQGTEYLYSTGAVLAGTLFWESRLSDSHRVSEDAEMFRIVTVTSYTCTTCCRLGSLARPGFTRRSWERPRCTIELITWGREQLHIDLVQRKFEQCQMTKESFRKWNRLQKTRKSNTT